MPTADVGGTLAVVDEPLPPDSAFDRHGVALRSRIQTSSRRTGGGVDWKLQLGFFEMDADSRLNAPSKPARRI